mmetsp:Transcript_8208/g.27015  ORF Transcript_8208/g.27015 Transcript_8208/m.27015 type:complete len:204 (+) Transcript_8208:1877-2488(+)
MPKNKPIKTIVNTLLMLSITFTDPNAITAPRPTVKPIVLASSVSAGSIVSIISPALAIYATNKVVEANKYVADMTYDPVLPNVVIAMSGNEITTGEWPRPCSNRTSSLSLITLTLISANNNAESKSNVHVPTMPKMEGTTPVSAQTLGNAKIPAPTVDPVISATTPVNVPLLSMLLFCNIISSNAVGGEYESKNAVWSASNDA